MEAMTFDWKGTDIYTFECQGEQIFDPYNVGKVLGYADNTIRKMTSKLRADDRNYGTNKVMRVPSMLVVSGEGVDDFGSGKQLFLTESGVLTFIMNSKTEEAIEFQDFILEVLRQIRKHGYYVSGEIKEAVSEVTNYLRLTEKILGVKGIELRTLQDASIRQRLWLFAVTICKTQGINSVEFYDNLFEDIKQTLGWDLESIAKKKGKSRMDFIASDEAILKFVYTHALRLYGAKNYEVQLHGEGNINLLPKGDN